MLRRCKTSHRKWCERWKAWNLCLAKTGHSEFLLVDGEITPIFRQESHWIDNVAHAVSRRSFFSWIYHFLWYYSYGLGANIRYFDLVNGLYYLFISLRFPVGSISAWSSEACRSEVASQQSPIKVWWAERKAWYWSSWSWLGCKVYWTWR